MRVIARLNMGGPSHHVAILGGGLDPERYETLLLHGDVGAGEDSLEDEVRSVGTAMARVPGLHPELRPDDDARALGSLVRHIRRLRPDILHTHTAKAGTLGRTAAVLAGAPRPVIVHTYHGHVLEGYFGRVRNGLYRAVERRLGNATDALVGVSPATVDDLVRLRIAPRERFRVIPIGLNLEPFLSATRANGAAFRAEAGAGPEDVLLTFVGRLAPIKRVDVLLRAFRVALDAGAPVRLAVVGDGRLRADLEGLAHRLGVHDRVSFAGYRADMVAVAAAADVAVLTSDNEGTPVSLIEAGAAGNPAVSTGAGGVESVVTADSGLVVETGDHQAMGHAISELARDEARRHDMGRAARAYVAAHFSQDRLVADIDALYSELLAGSRVTVGGGAPIDSPLRDRTELA